MPEAQTSHDEHDKHEQMVAKHAEGSALPAEHTSFAGVKPDLLEHKPAEEEDVDLEEYANQLTPDRPVGKMPEHHEEIVVPAASESQGGDVADLESYRQEIAAKEAPRVIELPEKESASTTIGTEDEFKKYAADVDDESRKSRQEKAEKVSWFDKWFLGKKPPRNES